MSRVAKMHLGDCPALKGFAGRRRGMGMGDTDRLAESALDLCVCYGAIYEETVAPFPCLFATEAAVQILAVRLHLLPLWDSPPPPPSFLVSHPVSLYTSFVKHTKEDRHTIGGHFSIALALCWCADTG